MLSNLNIKDLVLLIKYCDRQVVASEPCHASQTFIKIKLLSSIDLFRGDKRDYKKENNLTLRDLSQIYMGVSS